MIYHTENENIQTSQSSRLSNNHLLIHLLNFYFQTEEIQYEQIDGNQLFSSYIIFNSF
jgi:hypothetical protein